MKRLLDLLNDSSRKIWILNCKYCPGQTMVERGFVVEYSRRYQSPFAIDAIREIDKYNYDTFSLAYKKEREEIYKRKVEDSKMKAVWSFCYDVKKNDVVLFVTGNKIKGYYVVTGEKIKMKDEGESILHGWNAEMISFENSLCITKDFQHPFFKPIDGFRELVIDALKQKSGIFPVDVNYKGHFVIPDGITEIPEEAFKDCTGITGVSIPNSVSKIGESAFFGCRTLTSIKIPNSVREIGGWAFLTCSSLTNVEIPNSVSRIGASSFNFCTSLTKVEIPQSVVWIGESSFASCYSLTEINVSPLNSHYLSHDGVLFSKDKSCLVAYPGAKTDEYYVIPRETNIIEGHAFFFCIHLTKLYIHENVSEIKANWFDTCTNLKEIHILHENPYAIKVSFEDEPIYDITLYVPVGSLYSYRRHPEFSKFKNIITEKCNVYKTDLTINQSSHEFVDLGLPSGTLWATCNIGANKPEDYGDFFAWGEVKPKEEYDKNTYKWLDGSDFTKYDPETPNHKKILLSEDDAATANWGQNWRMPTSEEKDELIEQCKWTWGELNGVCGYKVEAKNGKWIFFPASGFRNDNPVIEEGGIRNDNLLIDEGYYGGFWTSSLCEGEIRDENHNIEKNTYALCLGFFGVDFFSELGLRSNGYNIRPIMKQGQAIMEYLNKNGFSAKIIERAMYCYNIGKLTYGTITSYVEDDYDRLMILKEKDAKLSEAKDLTDQNSNSTVCVDT